MIRPEVTLFGCRNVKKQEPTNLVGEAAEASHWLDGQFQTRPGLRSLFTARVLELWKLEEEPASTEDKMNVLLACGSGAVGPIWSTQLQE